MSADVRLPDLFDLPAPSAPGSVTSEDAADALDQMVRASQHRSIMLCLSLVPADATLSRYELHQRTGIAINVLCARLKCDLEPTWVEAVPRARPSHVKPTLRVNGYRLTRAGRARILEDEVTVDG